MEGLNQSHQNKDNKFYEKILTFKFVSKYTIIVLVSLAQLVWTMHNIRKFGVQTSATTKKQKKKYTIILFKEILTMWVLNNNDSFFFLREKIIIIITGVGVRTSDTPLIHLKKYKFITTRSLNQKILKNNNDTRLFFFLKKKTQKRINIFLSSEKQIFSFTFNSK